MENNDQRSVLIDENPDRFDSLLNKKDVFLEEWRMYKYKDMPRRYFDFDTTSHYIKYHIKKE
jgi:hypothetical protein